MPDFVAYQTQRGVENDVYVDRAHVLFPGARKQPEIAHDRFGALRGFERVSQELGLLVRRFGVVVRSREREL